MNAIVPLVRSGIFQREEMIASAKEIQNEYIKQKIEPAYIKLSKVRQIMQMENSNIDNIISDVIEEAKKGPMFYMNILRFFIQSKMFYSSHLIRNQVLSMNLKKELLFQRNTVLTITI